MVVVMEGVMVWEWVGHMVLAEWEDRARYVFLFTPDIA